MTVIDQQRQRPTEGQGRPLHGFPLSTPPNCLNLIQLFGVYQHYYIQQNSFPPHDSYTCIDCCVEHLNKAFGPNIAIYGHLQFGLPVFIIKQT